MADPTRGDSQDTAEALDDEVLPNGYPPDTYLGATDANDDAVTETFEERTQRLVPEDDDDRPSDTVDDEQQVPLTDEDLTDDLTGAEEASLHEDL